MLQEQTEDISPEQLSIAVSNSIDDLKKRLNELNLKASENSFAAKEQTIRRNASQTQDAAEKDRLLSNLSGVVDTWKLRVSEVTKGAAGIEGQLLETEKIHSDLKENFAGRMEEAKPALVVVRENLDRSSNEFAAMDQLLTNAINDAVSGLNTLIQESEFTPVVQSAAPIPEVKIESSSPSPSTDTGRNLASVIQAKEAKPLNGERFGSSIHRESGDVLSANQARPDSSDDMIRKLKAELENSKSVQTELSTDTANLQSDLRRAYREIVSLQSSLRESEMMVDELEKTKDSLWSTADGRLPSADTVSKQITQLQSDLEATRGDLRQSRQSLLLEQERSNSMIRSITSELEHSSTIGSGSSRCGHLRSGFW